MKVVHFVTSMDCVDLMQSSCVLDSCPERPDLIRARSTLTVSSDAGPRHKAAIISMMLMVTFDRFAGFALLHWAAIPMAAPRHSLSPADAAAAAASRRQQVARQEQLHRGSLSRGNSSDHIAAWGTLHGRDDGGNVGSSRRRLAAVNSLGSDYAKDMLWESAGSGGGGGGIGSSSGSRALRQIVEIRAADSKAGSSGAAAGDLVSTHNGTGWLPDIDPQQAVRAAFYLWVSAANLVGVSTMWAHAADAFDPGAAARCLFWPTSAETLHGMLQRKRHLGRFSPGLLHSEQARCRVCLDIWSKPSIVCCSNDEPV